MSIDSLDPRLVGAFARADRTIADDNFSVEVIEKAGDQRRKTIIRRLLLGALFSLAAIPLQDFALAMVEILAVSLIELEGRLVAQLLAPINSVGALLSLVLFSLRAVYARLLE